MLRFLSIDHLAVIDAARVEFEPGLNVLTGETGAGKSMLVEAIGLLLGGRATADLVRTGESQAAVQAAFEERSISNGTSGGELVVRRDITAQGRSRAFVDDVLVTAGTLKDRMSPLVELHGQHEHQMLLDPQSHLTLLDGFAAIDSLREEVASAFRDWKRLQQECDALQIDERERASRLDLLSFQIRELEEAKLQPGEEQDLEASRHVFGNAEKLQRLCGDAYGALYESDQSVLSTLAGVWKRVSELADVDPVFMAHLDARDAIKAQLEDLAALLRRYTNGMDASPERLQSIENRLALLARIKRKYGPTIDAAIARHGDLTEELGALSNADERRTTIEAEVRRARDAYVSRAQTLSARRRKAAAEFCRRLKAELADLAMAGAQFEVRFLPDVSEQSWNETGLDVAECYLSANVGEQPRPLARIASGGELSRVMLAIRTLAVAGTPGKTLIFDEVDAGIGGSVAEVVGRKLRELGTTFQVLCITHLPQIAAAGHAHFHISKSVADRRTRTHVSRLSSEERVGELARMIGGRADAAAARAAAREMLGESESKTKGESEGRAGDTRARRAR